jgi:hypothetical protein
MNHDPNRSAIATLTDICTDAARRYGDDWQAIEKHIRTRIETLSTSDRDALGEAIERILRYHAPHGGAATQ